MSLPARGSLINPDSRFSELKFEPDPDHLDHAEKYEESVVPRTRFVRDSSRSVISSNTSPDIVGFSQVGPSDRAVLYALYA